MDYKYIEQLVEHYFQCETTLQEEQILRTFFAQDEDKVPEALRHYRPLFAALAEKELLADDFDERILALTEGAPRVKARTVSLAERMRPLLRAAAVVAIVLALGQAMNLSTSSSSQQSDDINYANYKDTYDDPGMACDQVEDALQLMSEGFIQASKGDSLMSVLTQQPDSMSIN
ncbi:MAG: hypothetical protein IKZ48_07155 [Prevotella sp.]|nr:hypothetical protein [Prevotella sp.]